MSIKNFTGPKLITDAYSPGRYEHNTAVFRTCYFKPAYRRNTDSN
jgi:hypothetical protein